MSLQHAQATVDTDDQKPKKVGLLEQIVAGAIFVVPLTGTFQPIEEYFNQALVRNVHASLYSPPTSYDATSAIHIFTLAILFFLSGANWRGMWRQAGAMLPLFAMICWSFASTYWSIDPTNTIHRVSHLADHVVFAAYLVARFSWREIVRLLTRCYGVILILNLGIMLFAPGYGLSNLEGYGNAWRGVFTQKNTLGSVAVMGVLIASYSFFLGANNRWFAGFVAIGQLLLLVMSRSATAKIALLAAFGLVIAAMAISVHRQSVARLFAILTILVGSVAAIMLFSSYDSINEMMGRSANLTGRTPIWHYVMKTIELRPLLGYGYGFWNTPSLPRLNLWTSVDWPMPHAHDEFLDVTLQTGIIGLCLEVFCLTLALARAMRLSLVLRDGKALFCGMMIAMLCVRGFTETVLTDPATSGWTWLVIAYLTLAHVAKEKTPISPYRTTALQQLTG
jgi:exopolysaccharide production protein ExoQ